MKLFFTLFFYLFYSSFYLSQTITPYQIGPFKVGKMLDTVNSELGLSIRFSNDDYKNFDFVRKVTLTEVEYTLVFQDAYNMNGMLLGKKLYSVSISTPIFKTAEGISIGSTKQEITQAYPLSDICMYNTYDENTGERLNNKTNITVDYVDGKTPGSYYFNLQNNAVKEIMISAIYQEEDISQY